jgi:hypothetical protein
VLRTLATSREELPQEEVRTHQPVAPKEEVEINLDGGKLCVIYSELGQKALH